MELIVGLVPGRAPTVHDMGVTSPNSKALPKKASQQPDPTGLRWPWLLSDRGILTTAGTVAIIGAAAMVAMLLIATGAEPTDRAGLRIEAIKYGLGFFAAAGAAAALLLGVRKQRLSERSHQLELRKQTHVETDAVERRVTELYTKAVEQLGSADAAVRLGGLYALERVAQNNPDQRQTVVNVLCAYLRMPYALPVAGVAAEATGGRDPRQELEVRLTAQKVVSSHLVPTDATGDRQTFWPDIDLNLAGATLIDWRFAGRLVRNAQFKGATFSGAARFEAATFAGPAGFDRAVFTGGAQFDRASFRRDARFGRAEFGGFASLRQAVFGGRAEFSEAVFGGEVWFEDAVFEGHPQFGDAEFRGDAWFDGARFTAGVTFGGAAFSGQARFDRAMIEGAARFDGARFAGDVRFERATFAGAAQFNNVTFARPPALEEAVVDARDARGDVWPPGWRLVSSGGTGRLTHSAG
jgi:uncharacterized protein YjbI with pentapeptide repeats